MGFFRSQQIEIKLFVFVLTFLFAGQGVVAFAASGRLYPSDNVTLYRNDAVVGVYTKEAPLPQGTVLSPQGRCAVKLDDAYLVAEDQSLFSITTTSRQRNLFLKQGTVYFKTAGMKQAFTFITPEGPISVQRIHLNAAAGDASIKGYVAVNEGGSEMGIAEGGSMEVYTDDGLTTIRPGNKIILTQADMDIGIPEAEEPAEQEAPQAQEERGWSKTATYVTLGALGVAAAAGIAIGLSGGGGDDDGEVSPSRP